MGRRVPDDPDVDSEIPTGTAAGLKRKLITATFAHGDFKTARSCCQLIKQHGRSGSDYDRILWVQGREASGSGYRCLLAPAVTGEALT